MNLTIYIYRHFISLNNKVFSTAVDSITYVLSEIFILNCQFNYNISGIFLLICLELIRQIQSYNKIIPTNKKYYKY